MFELLQSLPIAASLRRSIWLFPAIEIAHLAGIALLFGTVVVADLTLLGALRSPSLKASVRPLLAVTKTGIVLAACSGFLLFCSDPQEFWNNPAFRLKLAAFSLAIVNALLFQKYLAQSHSTSSSRLLTKISICMSLILWSAILTLGRAIAYV
ncbi:hypothetical protein [Brucella sp. IR073]|uniref:hypothetical protein n=1 Tax=unclassified Brucella TaxID=2632610 RepID=UPI003B97E86B